MNHFGCKHCWYSCKHTINSVNRTWNFQSRGSYDRVGNTRRIPDFSLKQINVGNNKQKKKTSFSINDILHPPPSHRFQCKFKHILTPKIFSYNFYGRPEKNDIRYKVIKKTSLACHINQIFYIFNSFILQNFLVRILIIYSTT